MVDGPEGATPLDPDEAEDLIPTHIHTREELNLWEQENILEAVTWARRMRVPALSDLGVLELHRRMFDRTWSWAGRYRTSDKNIGVYWATIPVEVRKLLDDGPALPISSRFGRPTVRITNRFWTCTFPAVRLSSSPNPVA